MLLSDRWLSSSCAFSLAVLALGCEEAKPTEPEKEAPVASAVAAATPEPEPAPEPEPEAKPSRPTTIDFEVTNERRAAIEKAHPEAKGFLVASAIEDKLKQNKAVKEEANAVKAFDAAAKKRWVLFTGTLVNPTDNGFDLAIVYTPQLPNDPMGMSRQFFTVTLSEVQGYEKDALKLGTQVVVLAKYDGGKQASAAKELVASNVWQ